MREVSGELQQLIGDLEVVCDDADEVALMGRYNGDITARMQKLLCEAMKLAMRLYAREAGII